MDQSRGHTACRKTKDTCPRTCTYRHVHLQDTYRTPAGAHGPHRLTGHRVLPGESAGKASCRLPITAFQCCSRCQNGISITPFLLDAASRPCFAVRRLQSRQVNRPPVPVQGYLHAEVLSSSPRWDPNLEGRGGKTLQSHASTPAGDAVGSFLGMRYPIQYLCDFTPAPRIRARLGRWQS